MIYDFLKENWKYVKWAALAAVILEVIILHSLEDHGFYINF